MGFSGLLELYKMYGIHQQPILKLTSALIGDVMEVAENSKNLDFSWFFGHKKFLDFKISLRFDPKRHASKYGL